MGVANPELSIGLPSLGLCNKVEGLNKTLAGIEVSVAKRKRRPVEFLNTNGINLVLCLL